LILTGGLWRSGKFGCSGRGIGAGRRERSRGLNCCARRRHLRRGIAANGGRSLWSSDGICCKPLLVLYVRDAEDKCCTTCRDKHGRRCNYFDYRNRCHNDHTSADGSPPILQIDSAPIWFAHQVQPKMDCRSAVLTDAVREALGLTIQDKLRAIAAGR
jgi:hypothetical protein